MSRLCLTLIVSIVFFGTSRGQNKCYLNQNNECKNAVKAWSVLLGGVAVQQSRTLVYSHSNPDFTSLNSLSSFKTYHCLYSLSDTQNANPLYKLIIDQYNVLLDSIDEVECHNENPALDTTYCATAGSTPSIYASGVLTLGSHHKLFRSTDQDTSLRSYPYMLSIPDKSFFINNNYDLTQPISYPNGLTTTAQYAIRPATLSYLKPGVQNQSPHLATDLIFNLQVLQTYMLDLGVYDDDGDSVSVTHIAPYGLKLDQNINYSGSTLYFDSLQPYPLAPGLSSTLPMPASSYTVDPDKNKIVVTPTTLGFYNLMVRVSEYRDGALIAHNDVIVGVHVYPDAKKPIQIQGPQNISASSYSTSGNSIYTCEGDVVSFDVSIKFPSVGANLNNYGIEYRGFPSGVQPSYLISYTNQQDSIVLTFTYQTSTLDQGWKYIYIKTSDTSCIPEEGLEARASTSIALLTLDNSTHVLDSFRICAGDTVHFNTSGGLYRWIPISGDLGSLSCSNCPYPTVYPKVTTMYVAFPDTALLNCGQMLDTVLVEVIPDWDIEIEGDTVICDNAAYTRLDAVAIPSSPYLNYQWTPTARCVPDTLRSTQAYLTIDSGWFYIEVWDDFGCNRSYDSFIVRRNYYNPGARTSYIGPICERDTITAEAWGAETYNWTLKGATIVCDTCDTTLVYVNTQSDDSLKVVMVDSLGCKKEESFRIIVKKTPVANAGEDTVIYDGAVFGINGGKSQDFDSYTWLPTDYLFSSSALETEGQYIPETGDYVLYLKNGPCVDLDTVKVIVIPCMLTPIPNVFNPTIEVNNIFKPNMRDPNTIIDMKIYNRWGQKLYEEKGSAKTFNGWNGTYKGSMQPIETYVYVIEVDCIKTDGSPGHTKLEGTFTLIK